MSELGSAYCLGTKVEANAKAKVALVSRATRSHLACQFLNGKPTIKPNFIKPAGAGRLFHFASLRQYILPSAFVVLRQLKQKVTSQSCARGSERQRQRDRQAETESERDR